MTEQAFQPWMIDVVLVAFLAEGLALAGYRAMTGRGLTYTAVAANLLSGAMIVLAIRALLSGAGLGVIAGCLLGSFAAHLWDLWLRFKQSG